MGEPHASPEVRELKLKTWSGGVSKALVVSDPSPIST